MHSIIKEAVENLVFLTPSVYSPVPTRICFARCFLTSHCEAVLMIAHKMRQITFPTSHHILMKCNSLHTPLQMLSNSWSSRAELISKLHLPGFHCITATLVTQCLGLNEGIVASDDFLDKVPCLSKAGDQKE